MGRWEEKRRRVLSGWHPPRPRLRVLWAGGGGVGREGAWAGATVVPPRRPAPRPPPCVVMAPARFPMVCAHVCIRSSATAPPPLPPPPRRVRGGCCSVRNELRASLPHSLQRRGQRQAGTRTHQPTQPNEQETHLREAPLRPSSDPYIPRPPVGR